MEQRVQVEQEGDSKKGRVFEAILIAKVTCATVLAQATSAQRPIFAMFAGSYNELRPFIANIQMGRKVEDAGKYRSATKYEFLKSVKYQVVWQIESEPKGAVYQPEPLSIATLYYPDAFKLDPGMVDPKGIEFCMLPTKEWIQKQAIDPTGPLEHMRKIIECKDVHHRTKEADLKDLAQRVTHAYLFAAYLDRRTRAPFPLDGRFFLQLFHACGEKGLLKTSTGAFRQYNYYEKFETDGLEEVGLEPCTAFSAKHSAFETLLSEQVTLYYRHI